MLVTAQLEFKHALRRGLTLAPAQTVMTPVKAPTQVHGVLIASVTALQAAPAHLAPAVLAGIESEKWPLSPDPCVATLRCSQALWAEMRLSTGCQKAPAGMAASRVIQEDTHQQPALWAVSNGCGGLAAPLKIMINDKRVPSHEHWRTQRKQRPVQGTAFKSGLVCLEAMATDVIALRLPPVRIGRLKSATNPKLADAALKLGMTAPIDIRTDSRPVPKYLAKPPSKAFGEAMNAN